jgi:MoxR-like ATPase
MEIFSKKRVNDLNYAEQVLTEVRRAIVGKDDMILKTFLTMLSGGHLLLEDKPGVGKTTLALAFSRALQLDYKRMQFTPDVMPTDVTGFTIYNKSTGHNDYQKGAILCNLFLADELNRASSRTQAALLEAMEEGQVTVDGETHPLPRPFMVIAAQNPYGSSGTQLLPDSQMDRFMMRLSMGYPAPESELELLRRKQEGNPLEEIHAVADQATLVAIQQQVAQVYASDDIFKYIIRLTTATRNHQDLRQGASPRASVALASVSRAVAWVQGRDYVIPSDVQFIFADVAAHRLLLTRQAEQDQKTARDICTTILHKTPAPKIK